jgi:alpha-galactosidase
MSLGKLFLLSGLLVPSMYTHTFAQGNHIQFDQQARVFRIDGNNVTYAFGINEENALQPLYWGARLGGNDTLGPARVDTVPASFDLPSGATPQEFQGWGAGLFYEPALKIMFPDGNRDLVLHYIDHHIDGDTLTIQLKDISRDVTVGLKYQIDPDTGVLGRSAVITNKTKEPVLIEQAAAASWSLPAGTDYWLYYLTGRWAGEMNVQHEAVRPGTRLIESRRGSTGHQNNPWFAIERGDSGDQDTGDVWFGALAWSGSWRITVEQDTLRQVRITGGYNPFDFGYKLAPNEQLETPVFFGGYSHHGIGGASRLLHQFEITKVLPQAPKPRPRPVLYNSWEATEFNVTEQGQEELAQKAAKIGVERFVMDDGWFGQRKDDHAGLGDWYVNKEKFPNGLKPLIDKVHSLGMDFGLWVEPEMVNPNSDLYRNHPDWVLNFTGRPRTEGRNQLVLNLARQDVRDYVFGFLDKLLDENDIAFLKWDYNRNWSEPGWPAVTPDEQKKVYIKYIDNLYSILKELREKHPKVEIESCSGGGGRVDLGILRYTDEVWPSDNTDPFDRLSIQNGFTYAYTPGVMMAWVTESPSGANHSPRSTEYRFLSSMQGALAVGANLNHWADADFNTAQHLISEYKAIRETVQHGALYRLISPANGSEFSATESVAADGSQAAVFAFLHSSQFGYPYPRLFLRGLDKDAQYKLHWITEKPGGKLPATASGAYWMGQGVDLNLDGDFQATAFQLEKAH